MYIVDPDSSDEDPLGIEAPLDLLTLGMGTVWSYRDLLENIRRHGWEVGIVSLGR